QSCGRPPGRFGACAKAPPAVRDETTANQIAPRRSRLIRVDPLGSIGIPGLAGTGRSRAHLGDSSPSSTLLRRLALRDLARTLENQSEPDRRRLTGAGTGRTNVVVRIPGGRLERPAAQHKVDVLTGSLDFNGSIVERVFQVVGGTARGIQYRLK